MARRAQRRPVIREDGAPREHHDAGPQARVRQGGPQGLRSHIWAVALAGLALLACGDPHGATGPATTGGSRHATSLSDRAAPHLPETLAASGACQAGAPCTADTCRAGQVVCSGAAAACEDTGPAEDGTPCGVDQFCSGGSCVSCPEGAACEPPAGDCHTGAISCASGSPVCEPTVENEPDGTPCGNGSVCSAGACVACAQGASCTPTNSCHVGSTVCASGAPVCFDTGASLTDGSACGSGEVCSAGACVACAAGASCTPPGNPCHTGTLSCTGGTAVCADLHANAPDGTSCGTDQVCNTGSCVSCVANLDCQPENLCDIGLTSCATGTSTCGDTQIGVPDGTVVAPHVTCVDRTSTPTGFSIVSGANQTVTVDTWSDAVQILLTDSDGNPLPAVAVTVTPPLGGAVAPATIQTDLDGHAFFSVLLPRAAGAASWTIAATGQTSILLPETAQAVGPGLVYTVADYDRSSANSGIPGPAILAHSGEPLDVALAADGTIYFTDYDYNEVHAISPAGVMTTVAGNGQSGSGGNGGQATSASLSGVEGLALDQTNHLLYIGEIYNSDVRVVNLTTGFISLYAGGGSAAGPAYGDGGPLSGASFSQVHDVELGPDGMLYIVDWGNNRIRRVNRTANPPTIEAFVSGTSTCPSSGIAAYSFNSGNGAGGIAWDPSGNAYVSGIFFGPATNCNGYWGIARVNANLTLTPVAGTTYGSSSLGIPATEAAFSDNARMAFDPAGNLYAAFPGQQVIDRIDGATGILTNVLGNGQNGFAGELAPPAGSEVYSPWGLAFDASQNLVFADADNSAVRILTAAGSTAAETLQLSKTAGDAQTTLADEYAPDLLQVTLTSDGAPLVGAQVQWVAQEAGGWVSNAVSLTDTTGASTVQVRAGRQPGTYHFVASFLSTNGQAPAGGAVTFTLTAGAQPAGNIYSIVNAHGNAYRGNVGSPQVATEALVSYGAYAIVASDGTVYFTDWNNHAVRAVSPAGMLTTIAGGNGAGFSGDNGPAASAQLNNPNGLALDATTNTLYIADNNNQAVRAVNLAATPPTITTFAGRGTATSAPWGDGGPAKSAVFGSPVQLSIGPGRVLYVSDGGGSQNNIRSIALTDTTTPYKIETWLSQSTNACPAQAVGFWSCEGYTYCSMSWDAAGNAYVSGEFTDSVTAGCYGAYGVVRVSAGSGTLTRIAGLPDVTSQVSGYSGFPAISVPFNTVPTIALDSAGNLFLSFLNGNQGSEIQRVDASTGLLTTIAGNGTQGYVGNGTAASSAELNQPEGMAMDSSGNLIVVDNQNAAVRVIAGVGVTTPTGAKLTAVGSSLPATAVDGLVPVPLQVQLTDGSNNPLAGRLITWTAPAGAGIYSAGTLTDENGIASNEARLGWTPGSDAFTASFNTNLGTPATGSPVTLTVTAAAPTTGDILTIENAHPSVSVAVPGPATLYSPGSNARGMAVAPNGTIYLGTDCAVYVLSASGILSLFAGTPGSCGYSGDGMAATSAQTDIGGIAIDPGGTTLYIADNAHGRVRAVSFATGLISTYAGGGSGSAPNNGDGGAATAAVLQNPTHVAVGPAPDGTSNHYLFISDTGHNAIRYVDASGDIHTYLAATGSSCSSAALSLYSCNVGQDQQHDSCEIQWDSAGNAYVAGDLTGTDIANGQGTCGWSYGIAKINAGEGTSPVLNTLVAGQDKGSTANGVLATQALFLAPPKFVLDSSGDIYTSDASAHLIRYISAATGMITTIAGTGTAGYTGDYGPATAAELDGPWVGALVNGHLLFADSYNDSFREIW